MAASQNGPPQDLALNHVAEGLVTRPELAPTLEVEKIAKGPESDWSQHGVIHRYVN